MNEPRPFSRSKAALAAVGGVAFLLASEALFSTLSGNPADLSLFVGRFHPLAVHLPIGVVLLVAAAEALSLVPKFRPRVDPAIGLALAALVVTSLGTFLLGQLLARSGDFPPRALNLHRRLEFFAVVGVCACLAAWSFHASANSARSRLAYRVVLGATLTLMSVGAHFGGTLTRGENYLSRYAPGPLKALLGGAREQEDRNEPEAKAAPGSEPTFFASAVGPILNERCATCHGSEKAKGGLRLDTFSALQKGGESGSVVTPYAPKQSALLTKVLLPLDDDEHMPPKEKPQPTPAEVAVLSFWIERGANDKLLLRDALPPSEARALLEKALSAAPPPSPSGSASAAPPAPAAPSGSNTPTATSTDPAPAAREPAAVPAPPSVPDAPPPTTSPSSSGASPRPTAPSRPALAILSGACGACHGAQKQKAKLRLDSLDAILAGGKTGPAVVPGKPADSELIRRVGLPLSDDEHMPPDDEPQLGAGDVQVLVAWVRGLSARERVANTQPAGGSAAAPETAPVSDSPTSGAEPPAAAASPIVPPAAGSGPKRPASAQEAALSPEQLASLPARLVLFPDAVAPMLLDRCGKCHTGEKPAMGLRVDDHATLMKGGLSGPALIPGKPEDSLLVQRVSLPLEDGDHMPPEDEPQLSAGEVSLLKTWIRHGAALAFELDTGALSPEAQRAVAARPPKARHGTPAATLGGGSGGCAACTVGRAGAPGLGGWAVLSSLVLSLVFRRNARSRGAHHRPSVPI